METYKSIINMVNVNLISCLIPAIISLVFIRLIFNDRFETKKALNIYRWLIIAYTIFSAIPFLVGITILDTSHQYHPINGISGPFFFTYWIMIIAGLVLPLTLFIKKLGNKSWYLILIAFCMNMGLYIEQFIIMITSLHRDGSLSESQFSFISELSILLPIQGLIITILTLGILEIIKKRTSV
ncbi:hypothetical protein OAH12_01950 [Cyclobacteriaceae bacterium]|nr:hypothetical protein [Cyclobacteriaceae bacterium]